MSKKGVILYYTWSGRTQQMANIISRQTGAKLQEIRPEVPYSENYHTVVSDAKKEIREGARPAVQKLACDLSEYDVIYVGTPIWWGTMAPPVATVLSENDLSEKTMMPFTTHGGGGKGHSDRDIAKLCPHSKVMDMYTAYEGGGKAAEREIAAWIQQNGLSE